MKQNVIDPELGLVLVGAGGCQKELLALAKAAGLRVSFGYGLTETSSGVAISTGDDPFAMAVCPDDFIEIADDGEILISAPTCMMQGYYKREKDTAAVLKAGVLATGDTGYFDERGLLHVAGRKKDVLTLENGTKIFLPEYEAELAAVLEHSEVAVTTVNMKPVLVYGGTDREAVIMDKIKPLMAEKPLGQRITKVVFFKEPLPRTATGKLKRWELQRKGYMTKEQVLTSIRNVVQDSMPELDVSDMDADTVIAATGIESMGLMLIICRLEAMFDIRIPDNEWGKLVTIGDVADAIIERSAAK